LIVHWQNAKRPFFVQLAGFAVIIWGRSLLTDELGECDSRDCVAEHAELRTKTHCPLNGLGWSQPIEDGAQAASAT
jgi:hypothetical protein